MAHGLCIGQCQTLCGLGMCAHNLTIMVYSCQEARSGAGISPVDKRIPPGAEGAVKGNKDFRGAEGAAAKNQEFAAPKAPRRKNSEFTAPKASQRKKIRISRRQRRRGEKIQ